MRRWLLIGVIAIGVVALVGYGYGSYVLYDRISAVAADCGGRTGDGQRFQENTPAGWTLANRADVDDTWAASSLALNVAP